MKLALNKTGPRDDPPIGEDGPLYTAHKKVHPQSVCGNFRTIKWRLMVVCLGIYYLLPFVRWRRGLVAPDQAVLLDFPNRRFYFFFIELWPQELYYVTGLLVLAALALFLMNALGGRIWCGYLCPQTAWTDLFYAVERWVEGDRRDRLRAAARPMTVERAAKRVLKHVVWLMIAWWTGGAWALYFVDAHTLVRDLATFQAPAIAYIWIGILTVTTYLLAGYMREQVCVYMCPWPRIQAALTDEWALNVTYKYDRGEQRCSLKRSFDLRARWKDRRLHRLQSMRGGLSDRRRYSQRRPARLHPVRAMHRRLRCRHEEDRARRSPDRLRQRHQYQAPHGRQVGALQAGAPADDRICVFDLGRLCDDALWVVVQNTARRQRAARS